MPDDPTTQQIGAVLWLDSLCDGSVGLGLSGSGWPDLAIEWVRDACLAHSRLDGHNAAMRAIWEFWAPYPYGAKQLLGSALDRAGLLEYGATWELAWLSGHGKRFLHVLGDVEDFEALYDKVNEVAPGCFGSACPGCEAIREYLRVGVPHAP